MFEKRFRGPETLAVNDFLRGHFICDSLSRAPNNIPHPQIIILRQELKSHLWVQEISALTI